MPFVCQRRETAAAELGGSPRHAGGRQCPGSSPTLEMLRLCPPAISRRPRRTPAVAPGQGRPRWGEPSSRFSAWACH
eukprot:11817493-Alexandrium_andersonii.AAC.1